MLLLLGSLFLICVASDAYEGKRLIQFSDSEKTWLDQAEVDKLTSAAGVHHFMDVTDYDQFYSTMTSDVAANPIPTQPAHQEYVKNLLPLASADEITDFIKYLEAFHTRYFRSETGVEASHGVLKAFTDIGKPANIPVEPFTYTSFNQISVIATIPGSGPNNHSVVIIGAHLDCVSSGTARSPGADDDASGTATVLEIFRVLVQSGYKPDYTLEFHAYAGEEGGLLGSQGIATLYKQNNIDVQAMLQLDMTGYDKNAIGIIGDYTSGALNAFVKTLVSTYTSLNWVDSLCGYGCSDHASWNRTGYRSAFPFETAFGNHNPSIHTANDVLNNLDPNQMLEFVYLGIGFAVELAGLAQ